MPSQKKPTALVVDCGTLFMDEIRDMLAGYDLTVVPERSLATMHAPAADLTVVSGASHVPSLFSSPEVHKPLLDTILGAERPLIGICFGCEAIAVAFGGSLKDYGERQFAKEKKVTFGEEVLEVYVSHKYGVAEPGEQLEVLARDADGRIEVLKHKTRKVVGVQFHPEKSKERDAIFGRLLNLVGAPNPRNG